MARLNDAAQWIILMGFLVSFAFFFLALVINQSTVVGQTTAESVIEFPKNDIQDVRQVILQTKDYPNTDLVRVRSDITNLSITRKSAVVNFTSVNIDNETHILIHYNNGVTEYNENWSAL
jgi:hypothetical protein